MSGFLIKPCGAEELGKVKANTPIDGDGSSASPLDINTPALAGLLVDGKTTTVVGGKIVAMGGNGSIINNTVAAASDNTINGDGTANAPLGVNTDAIVDGTTIRSVGGKLQAVPQPATATVTDANTITGNGTQAAPLMVNVNALADGNTIRVQGGKLQAVPQPATATVTDNTVNGDGTNTRPLGVNVAALVDGNTTTVQGGKIKVNFPDDKQGITDAELQGTNIVLKNATGGTVRLLNIGNLIPAAAADRFLKAVRYDQGAQQFVFTVGDSTSNNDQTINVPAGDLIPVTVGDGLTGRGTATEPLKVRHDNTLTMKNGELSVVPAAEKDCETVNNIDTFGRDGKKGFTCFIADYRTTLGLPMDFPSTESEQEATTQLYPDRRNIYSGYKIGTADGAIVFVYENTTDGRAIGWSRTYQGTTASKWVRETALIPPVSGGGGLAAVNASAPLTGAGTTGSPLALDRNALANALADGKTVQANNGKLESLIGSKVGKEVTGIGQDANATGIYLGNNLYAVEAEAKATGFAKEGNVPVVVTGGQGAEKAAMSVAFAGLKLPKLGSIVDNQQGYEVSRLEFTPLSTYFYSGTQPDGITNPKYLISDIRLADAPISGTYNANTVVANAYVLGVPEGQEGTFSADFKYRFLVRVPENAPYGVHKGTGNQGGGAVVPPPPPPPSGPDSPPSPPAQPSDKPQHGTAGSNTVFRFANAAAGKEWATSDDNKVVISTDDSISRKGKNWTGLVVDSDKGKAIRTQVADEAKGYLGVFADADAFNITPDKNVTIFMPFKIDGIGNRPSQPLLTYLNGDDALAATGGFAVQHVPAENNFIVTRQSYTGRTINGKQVDAETRLVKDQWYIAQIDFTGQTVTALRFGAPAGGNGGISATFGSGLRVVEGLQDQEKRQYLEELAAQYGINLA